MAVLHKTTEIPQDEAMTIFTKYAHDQLDCEIGFVPDGRSVHAFRLCRECAAKTEAVIVEEAATRLGAVAGYVEPQVEFDA